MKTNQDSMESRIVFFSWLIWFSNMFFIPRKVDYSNLDHRLGTLNKPGTQSCLKKGNVPRFSRL